MTDGPPRPPPPPPRRPLPPPRGARPLPATEPPAIVAPAPGEKMSEASKEAIAEMALGLLEEQVQARIVHYKADLSTNPELDAITAEVVAQLKQMQSQVMSQAAERTTDRAEIAASQERILKSLLGRVFPEGAPSLVIEKRTKGLVRQLARLFFQSELHDKTRGQDATKVIQHGEQAIYYLLVRYQHRMKNELEGFDYADADIHDRSFALLAKLTKDMQDAFLSRRSTALKRLVSIFNAVLVDFYCGQMPKTIGALAHEVVAQSGSAEGKAYGYKIVAESFPRFRVAFERRFMVRLVGFVEDELVRRLADTAGADRDETLKFITDPHIFSMICGELCEAIYEYLCNEGFLDLPPDWRAAADRPSIV